MNKYVLLLAVVLTYLPIAVIAQSIIDSKHNLSVTSLGTIKATSESEVCIFCHTPHNSNPKKPLWKKNTLGTTYVLYSSSTMDAIPGQPDGSSILCLSCHDGTIALGEVVSRPYLISMSNDMSARGNLTTDLSDDHPVSFVYDANVATSDGELKIPPLLNDELDHNSKLQCTSCHNPHNNTYENFLVASNEYSNLCYICHDRNYWQNSSHNTSSKSWNGVGKNPWEHLETAYTTVTQNACSNCHSMHNAVGKLRLLKSQNEENNCLDCHNGNVADKNIQADIAKPYSHSVYDYSGVHDPNEDILVVNKHVECQDCHNPHASNSSTANAPLVKGYNIGVSGVNQSGTEIQDVSYTYEICYKCHSGNAWTPSSAQPRVINQNDVRLEFETTNPSFHPVVGPRNNLDIAGNLIPPNTASTVLYCTSCHSSNDSGGSEGPHGSIYPYILKLQYETADYTKESAQAYALCYSCHDRANFIDKNRPNTFKEHRKHVVGEDTPCSVCHDPHGISGTQGNGINNSNLINFRTDVVFPFNGRLEFIDNGNFRGECYLTCHGEDHKPEIY